MRKKAFTATVKPGAWSSPFASVQWPSSIAYERIFYWPDPKGLGARQVREALGKRTAR
jgi:predicted lipoprotein